MGISFNLRKLKKYLIPFIIGLISFFGFSMFSCISVNALEEEPIIEDNTSESIDYDSLYYYSLDQQDESVNLSGLSNKVYWFQKPESSNDILVNIYTILFLYVVGYFTIKFITIIHNVSWEGRR